MSEKYIARSSAIAARSLGGEMVIMSAADSTLFSLNEVATLIWQSADGQTSLAQIAERVCREFEVDLDTAYRDAEHLVQRLVEHGILLVSDQPIATGSPAR